MLLADLGAEVIKVENAAIGGDPLAQDRPLSCWAPTTASITQAFNINKKSVSLDLRTDEGKAALKELAATADALLNNLRGDLARQARARVQVDVGRSTPNWFACTFRPTAATSAPHGPVMTI